VTGVLMDKILVVSSSDEDLVLLSRELEKRIKGGKIYGTLLGVETLRKAGVVLPDVIVLWAVKGDSRVQEIVEKFKSDPRTHTSLILLCHSDGIPSETVSRAVEFGVDVVLHGPPEMDHLASQVRGMLRLKGSLDRLREECDSLKKEIDEKTRTLKERTEDLAKRLKELDCFYGLAELRERPGMTLEGVLQGVADLVASACRHPEITCARVLLGYQEFKTSNFKETPWKLSCDINVQGEWAGTLEVYYLEPPEDGQSPFLKEEESLLTAIAERLGRIAERVQAEESLRLESENLINILKSMEDWVYKVNAQYEVEYANPALQREFGPPNGRKCFEYFHGRKAPCSGCKARMVFRGETVRREFYFQKKQKTFDVLDTPIINSDGSISKLSIFRDLTAITLAQKALEERELLYRSVTESAADGAVMVQDGKILFANHAFVMMFGYENPAEVAGREVVHLFDPDFRELFRRVFDPSEEDSTLENLVRGVGIARDQRKFWVSINRRVIRLKSKPAILATMRDITEDMIQEESVQEVAEHLLKENIKLRSSIKERYRFGDIVGKSRPMQEVYELILKAAGSMANVIILGESGTGKELVARAIHAMSARADKAFVPVNCGAIPEALAESEFFGHRKGAFTGAHIDKTGYLDTADGGTLFLDEVGELGLNIQVKLLRALENGEYTPVGDARPKKSDLRIISATNRDFQGLVGRGLIREDFYYRISVIPIRLPPLRERKEDIPLLVEHFLRMYGKENLVRAIPGKVTEILYNYDWPGNVRELQSVVQRYLAVGNFDFLSPEMRRDSKEDQIELEEAQKVRDLRKARENFEKRMILAALNQNRWHRGKAAAALNIDPKTLYTKMKKTGIL